MSSAAACAPAEFDRALTAALTEHGQHTGCPSAAQGAHAPNRVFFSPVAWTEFTWNPATGCKVVSAACGNCHARTTAENKRGTSAFPNGFDVQFWPERLGKPARRRKPTLIFAGSMTDFFQVDIPDWQRDALCDAIEAAPQHTSRS